jgi:hypothetical protein
MPATARLVSSSGFCAAYSSRLAAPSSLEVRPPLESGLSSKMRTSGGQQCAHTFAPQSLGDDGAWACSVDLQAVADARLGEDDGWVRGVGFQLLA